MRPVRLRCFYPRAREGRDLVVVQVRLMMRVSIRAPVKDATSVLLFMLGVKNVSIRAPVKDATATD